MSDFEPVDCHTTTAPIARKEHRCDACYTTIKPGRSYERHTYVFDGKWKVWKQCGECASLTRELFDCTFLENIHIEVFEHDERYEHPLMRAYIERYIEHLLRRADREPELAVRLVDEVGELREYLDE